MDKKEKYHLVEELKEIDNKNPGKIPVNYRLLETVNDKSFIRVTNSPYYNSEAVYCQVFYKPIGQIIV
jgi:hypothetical protein